MNRHRLSKLIGGLLVLWLPVLAGANSYSERWGPDIGEALPEFELRDQTGEKRTLDSIMGERGVLIFYNRSADW